MQPHTNGTDPSNSSLCLCMKFFTRIDNKCQLNCFGAPYSKNTTTTSGDCVCLAGYTWDSILKVCVPGNSSKGIAIGVGIGIGVGLPFAIAIIAAIAYAMSGGASPSAVAAPGSYSATNIASGSMNSVPIKSRGPATATTIAPSSNMLSGTSQSIVPRPSVPSNLSIPKIVTSRNF